ncbi:ABC transporter substrate-binding protein [Lederbergia lenta]|uniref:Family 1 extracellular solute-binding protein n=1 Tax=Lederbergia lenta TaxID=1467 RepID=A0A2X4YSN5_LEDLE|nr:extracellular solute-binding protein [Lederbergia lenta]MCM3113282.1 extracellular solute-binding protein [Lederbergia lenta]MEC2326374.1 extracellular solute-binding protein [Lederbergia lenta]SQI51364.1 family 1 extracellular solute-binding protein [Lederbergia lenta]
MKEKKFGFLVLIMSLMLVLLAACGGDKTGGDKNNSNGSGDTSSKKDEINIRVVTTMAGTDPAGEVFEEVLKEFQNENKHIKITNESQSADGGTIRTKVNTDFSSDNEPELMFYFNTVDAEGIIKEGKVIDLENSEGINLDGYNSMLEQQRNEDGKLYAAPQTGFYEALFVNKKLFEEHGIELPTTWELYEKAIEEFAKTDIIPVAASTEDSYYVVEHYALAAGGMDNYGAELADKNPKWAEGLDVIAKHEKLGAFPKDAATIDLTMAQNLFHQEQAAMMFEGSWAWGGIKEAEIADNVTVLPMPIFGDGETGELVGGASQGWFISTKAFNDDKKREATVDLFNFLTSEETILRIAEATGQIPAKGQLTDVDPNIAAGHELVAKAPAAVSPINDRINPEAFTHIRTSVPEIVSGAKTGEQVIEEAAAME